MMTAASVPGALASSYSYDASGLLATVSSPAGTRADTWDMAAGLALLLSDGTDDYLYGPAGTPVAQAGLGNGNVQYFVSDDQGSTRALFGASGSLDATFSYDAYGNLTSSSGTASTPLLYDGQYLDPTSGFYYLRARWYDPATASFTSVDPLVSQTEQAYAYAGDDPVNGGDPSGLAFFSQCSGLPVGNSQASCDVGILYKEEYGSLPNGDIWTLAATGAAGGATIGAVVGGPIAPVAGAAGGVVGFIAGAITGYVEGNKAATSYITPSFVESSVIAVLNIIYLDNLQTEPSPSDIQQRGGLRDYEWAALSGAPQFGWFYNTLAGTLTSHFLVGALADFVKSEIKSAVSAAAMAPAAYTAPLKRAACG